MKNLNFRHLFYFWAVAQRGHLTRTAEELHVSQSALSAQIRQLEAYLGAPLFERERRELQLTDFGASVLDYADSIFRLGQELMASVRGGPGRSIQQLHVGLVATLSRNFTESLLRPLFGRSDVRLALKSGSLDELLEGLRLHKIDVVLSNKPVVAGGERPWRCTKLSRQAVCLIGPRRAVRRRFKLPEDLRGKRMVLPGPSSDVRTQFDLWCERKQLSIEVAAEVDDMAMLRLLARDSRAIALLPEVVVQDELRNGLLERYCVVPSVFEDFYAITAFRNSPSVLVREMLGRLMA
jgi:LysR family transcriptional activator of nhaA